VQIKVSENITELCKNKLSRTGIGRAIPIPIVPPIRVPPTAPPGIILESIRFNQYHVIPTAIAKEKFKLFFQIFNFWPKFWFLTKISIFYQNFDFWLKLPFWLEFQFWNKISIFQHNFDFWTKFRFFIKISIFELNLDFSSKFRFLTNISIFDRNYDFWLKFLKKFSIYNINFYF